MAILRILTSWKMTDFSLIMEVHEDPQGSFQEVSSDTRMHPKSSWIDFMIIIFSCFPMTEFREPDFLNTDFAIWKTPMRSTDS